MTVLEMRRLIERMDDEDEIKFFSSVNDQAEAEVVEACIDLSVCSVMITLTPKRVGS